MGKDFSPQRVRRVSFGVAPLAVAALCLGGCTLSGGGLEDMVDRSIVTNSIAPGAVPPTPAASPVADPDRLSDGRTVRNAVSAASIANGVSPLPWANAETGASGTITAISERRDGPIVCRSFTTSRQRFDGVAMYDGEACSAGAGEWILTRFSQNG
ncbi:RT0821/Lpp0805 family surface protein [Aureimonas frigidaquae]|uniref:RT0821/Lpp0805 family surface protein n=1 Tax=Aureimonas frigidaquae TaxID=424757 RepID=UPI000784ADF7|nr:RT0821/Lpp0805 family surface protein [Aureimonas frigidaquae]